MARGHGVRQRVTFLGERSDIADVLEPRTSSVSRIACASHMDWAAGGNGDGLPPPTSERPRPDLWWGREVSGSGACLGISELIGNGGSSEDGHPSERYHH